MSYLIKKIDAIIVVVITVFTCLLVVSSLDWPIFHDTALFYMLSHMMASYDSLPYRDIMEINPPGTHFLYYIHWLFVGYSDFKFRLLDIAHIFLYYYCFQKFLPSLSFKSKHLAACLFVFSYLFSGAHQSMQRDYLGFLFVCFGWFMVAGLRESSRPFIRLFMAGFLVGFAMTIKPTFGIYCPVLFFAPILMGESVKKCRYSVFFRYGLIFTFGCVLPIIIFVFKMYQQGNLDAFVELVTEIWPLYKSWGVGKKFIEYFYINFGTLEWGQTILERLNLFFWWPVSVISIVVCIVRSVKVKKLDPSLGVVYVFTLLSIFYIAYAAKYFAYHFIPLFFFLSLWIAMLANLVKSRILGIVFLGIIFVMIPHGFALQQFNRFLNNKPLNVKGLSEILDLSDDLRARLKSTDTVQNLDLVGGGANIIFRSRARLATRYFENFHYFDPPSELHSRAAFYAGDAFGEAKSAEPTYIINNKCQYKYWNQDVRIRIEDWLTQNYRILRKRRCLEILKIKNSST